MTGLLTTILRKPILFLSLYIYHIMVLLSNIFIVIPPAATGGRGR